MAACKRFFPLIALLVGTFTLAGSGNGLVRVLFVLGCLAVSLHAKRHGASLHFQVSIVLFCLAPLLRRLVDLNVGYEASGLMLTGPFLAILLPVGDVRRDTMMQSYVIVIGASVGYAASLSLFSGDLSSAVSGTLKWIAPLAYGRWLHQQAQKDEGLVVAAATVLVIVMPVLGVYAIWQYIDPPSWDRYWMTFTPIWSIGRPEPYEVRVFSTMNSPASYASFNICAILLIGICRKGWKSTVLLIPCITGLLLSLYRTAWIAVGVGAVICLWCALTRRRTSWLITAGCGAALMIAIATPFGDTIIDRFSTLTQGGGDYSVEERLREYSSKRSSDALVQ